MSTMAYQATVTLSNGNSQKVVVEADTAEKAKLMLETQYGNWRDNL